MNRPISLLFALLVILGFLGCARTPEVPAPPSLPPVEEKPAPPAPVSLTKLDDNFLRTIPFKDNGSKESIILAAEQSLKFFNGLPETKTFKADNVEFSVKEYRQALTTFVTMVRSDRATPEEIMKVFDLYAYSTDKGLGSVLATGYYEPILEGSIEPSKGFSYPLYPLPQDMVRVFLEDFGVSCKDATRLVGRMDGRKLVPYYTRKEIDNGAIANTKPLVWVRDPIDAFFLHIQGSGIIRLKNGVERRIGYAGSNGRSYKSIGKYMIDQGWLSKDEASMQGIKAYLKKHKEKLWETLWQDESYVFFEWTEVGPKGSTDVVLTPQRSIASDRRYYPPGVLSFVSTMVPEGEGKGLGFHRSVSKFNRWVFHHDAGGAIKGPRRIDIFFGSGPSAGETAGRMKEEGIMILLLPKRHD